MSPNDRIDNYKIIKTLGHGMSGTVYLVKKGNKKYALKIEHILEKDIKKSNKSLVWREIEFSIKFGNHHNDQFMKLVDYDIIDNCHHIQKYRFDLSYFPKNKQEEYKKLSQSKYCVRKVYTLIDTTLDKIIEKLTIKQIYSMIVQIAYALYLLHSNNYIHGDFHWENVGVIKTKNKFIKIFDHNVPTYGYIYQLIDYGSILNKKDIANKKEETRFNEVIGYELRTIKDFLMITKFWKEVRKYKINTPFKEFYKEFRKTEEYHLIKTITNNKYSQMYLFDILYAEKSQRMTLGNKFKKVMKVKLLIPLEDILYMVKYENNYKDMIDYFIDKLL